MDNETELKNEVNEQAEDYVSKKAYKEVSQDMHKYKSELQSTKAKLAEIEAIQEAKEQERLEEQGKWEELYKKSQEQFKTLQSEREQEKSKFVDYHKKNSVLQKIGGFKRDEYNNFINVKDIQMNEDGSIDENSLTAEVDRIKQEYPELLKATPSVKLPKEAPNQGEIGNKSYEEMSEHEKAQLKRSLLKKPQGF